MMNEALPVIGWPDKEVAAVAVNGEFLVLPDIELADDPLSGPIRLAGTWQGAGLAAGRPR